MLFGLYHVTVLKLAVCCCFLPTVTSQDDYSDYYSYEDKPCSDSPNDIALACQKWTSCECSDSVVNCYCDSMCQYYGDCCENAGVSGVERRVYDKQVICQQQIINKQNVTMKTISECPDQYNDTDGTARKCSSRPVQGTELLVKGDDTGLIYANRDCCECHGESGCEYPQVDVLCQDKPTVDSIPVILHQILTTGSYVDAKNVSCFINYEMLDSEMQPTFRECILGLVYTCPSNTTTEDATKCETEPTSYVYEEKAMGGESSSPPYRNEWCAKCNGITRYNCQPPKSTGTPPEVRGLSSLVDLSAVSCIQDHLEDVLSVNRQCDDGKFVCPYGETYKPLQGCRETAVKDGDTLDDRACLEWHNSTEFVISNETVYFLDTNLSSKEYKVVGSSAYACVVKQPSKIVEEEKTKLTAYAIITVALLVISITCLLAQTILYCLFKPLRNIPGIILICLSLSLMLAELLFLVAIFMEAKIGFIGTESCATVAILQHFCFLASFFWTNIMAFDVCLMLARPMKSLGRSRMIWYNLYAWGCPLIVVVSAIAAELTDSNVSPSYADGRCWLSSKYGLLAYFLGPVFMILGLNVVLYTISVISIVKAARQTKMVNPNLKQRLYLAIKLIIIMGLPWILALFTAFLDSTVLDYIFGIVIGLQGAGIAVCYVLSKTVLNLLKKSDRLRRDTKSYSSGRTSTYSLSVRGSGNFKRGRRSGSESIIEKNSVAVTNRKLTDDSLAGTKVQPERSTIV